MPAKICECCGQPIKPRLVAKPRSLSLDAELPKAKRSWPVGAFTVLWDDGSETFVSGVPYAPGQPWPFAYQAADRLRRLRASHLWPEARDRRAHVFGINGTRFRSPWLWDIIRTKPMAPVAMIESQDGEIWAPDAAPVAIAA